MAPFGHGGKIEREIRGTHPRDVTITAGPSLAQLRSDKAKKQRGARRASIEIGYALCHDREEVTAKDAARNWKIICPPTNPRQGKGRVMKIEFREKSEP